MSTHRIVPAGDAAIVVEFEDRIDPAISARGAALANALETARIVGVRDVVPTYRSVAVYFDPLHTDRAALIRAIETLSLRARDVRDVRRDPIEIPVCYGGDFGPDLARVASYGGVTEATVIEWHAAVTYQVLMLGFMPGFAYMATVDPRIAAPRLDSPRPRVPRGSVGIAREQTGVYPGDTPGGWQLIGRAPVRPFDLSRPNPFLFRAGDDVRFVPIAATEFERLDRAS
ncbi:MAG TPA: 5-oxoprolinase subunit PxpB [Vicinamibacterales bacterium]|nr:5-oxoprolinase subunit PxpB [Vicinamibacterales bacterium]